MRVDVKKTKVYPFAELSDDAKEKVLESFAETTADYEWWDSEYEDAKNVLLKLTEFDLDRNRHCKGEFIENAKDTAQKIIEDHGDMCGTFQTAKGYLEDRRKLVEKYSGGINTQIVAEDNEYEFDNDCEELDADFLRSILEDYSIMLQKQYEYLTSEEAIVETIEANEYEFTEDGKLYS